MTDIAEMRAFIAAQLGALRQRQEALIRDADAAGGGIQICEGLLRIIDEGGPSPHELPKPMAEA